MKLRCFVFACFSLTLLLLASSASAGCWKCDADSGCCAEEVRGQYGRSFCSAIQMCLGGVADCRCSSCDTDGSLCAGTAEPECDNVNGICEQHRTNLDDAAPRVVPNGEAIDLRWLISPPDSPVREANPGTSTAACATVV